MRPTPAWPNYLSLGSSAAIISAVDFEYCLSCYLKSNFALLSSSGGKSEKSKPRELSEALREPSVQASPTPSKEPDGRGVQSDKSVQNSPFPLQNANFERKESSIVVSTDEDYVSLEDVSFLSVFLWCCIICNFILNNSLFRYFRKNYMRIRKART